MSVSVVGKVKRESTAQGSAFVVELILADEVRDGARPDWWPKKCDFPICWIGKRHLAEFARVTERTADRAIDALVEGGQLRKVAHDEIHLTVLPVIGKTGGSNLYILCTGQTASTLYRVEAYLRGGQIDPRQSDGVNGDTEGGKRRQKGGVTVTPETLKDTEKDTCARAHARARPTPQPEFPIGQLLPWAKPGCRAVFDYPGDATQEPRRIVGEIVVRQADGVLAFRSPSLPYTTPALEHLVGHLEPITGPPEPADAQHGET